MPGPGLSAGVESRQGGSWFKRVFDLGRTHGKAGAERTRISPAPGSHGTNQDACSASEFLNSGLAGILGCWEISLVWGELRTGVNFWALGGGGDVWISRQLIRAVRIDAPQRL